MANRPSVLSCLLAIVIGSSDALDNHAAPPSNEFHPLFNGRNLDGWYTFLQKHGKGHDPDRIVTIEDGAIHLYKHAAAGSLVAMGYISTEAEYENYHLRFRYRWGTKKFEPRLKLKQDAGFYYHIQGEDGIWPRSLQYQVEESNVGDLIALLGFRADTSIDPKTNAGDKPSFLPVEAGGEARVLASKPDGYAYQGRAATEKELDGWNTVEVICRGNTTTHLLNGKVVNAATGIRLVDANRPGDAPRPIRRGRIALEIEAAEVFFRDVEIKDLGAEPAR